MHSMHTLKGTLHVLTSSNITSWTSLCFRLIKNKETNVEAKILKLVQKRSRTLEVQASLKLSNAIQLSVMDKWFTALKMLQSTKR